MSFAYKIKIHIENTAKQPIEISKGLLVQPNTQNKCSNDSGEYFILNDFLSELMSVYGNFFDDCQWRNKIELLSVYMRIYNLS